MQHTARRSFGDNGVPANGKETTTRITEESTMGTNTELIARADAHVRSITSSFRGRMVDIIERGEGADERVALLVQVTRALEAAEAELARRQTVIDEARTANHFSPIKNYRVEEILSREPTGSGS